MHSDIVFRSSVGSVLQTEGISDGSTSFTARASPSHLAATIMAVCALLSIAAAPPDPPADAPPAPATSGRIESVTVYQGQALVTRVVEVQGHKGAQELLISDLPEEIVPASIHAEGSDSVSVRSISYRVRARPESPRDDVRAIDEQLAEFDVQLRDLEHRKNALDQRGKFLDKLENFTAGAAATTAATPGFNGPAIQEVAAFLIKSRQEQTSGHQQLAEQIRKLEAQRELLKRQRGELTATTKRELREALVPADVPNGAGTLRVRYLVKNAAWTPSYNARTSGERTTVVLDHNASIRQMTGEDWNNVQMTLSTASPALVSQAPSLQKLGVTLVSAAAERASADLAELRDQMSQAQRKNAERFNRGEVHGKELNVYAGQAQLGELTQPVRKADAPLVAGLSVSYQLANPATLPSRTDQQTVQIARHELAAEPYKVATPVLTEYVFQEVAVKNTTEQPLLAGPLVSYLDGQFVGNGELPTVSAGEPFAIGFGIDSSLRATRRLLDKSETQQGGNRIVDLTYELAIDSYSGTAQTVRLYDRLPVARDSEVRVTLGKDAPELSKDKRFRDEQRPQGILRWDIQTAAGEAPNRAAMRYSFRMEHDKQFTIVGLPEAPAIGMNLERAPQ